MTPYTQKIREISKRLLQEGKVDMVIGFARGSVAMINQPAFATHSADADRFVWDGNCGSNLANYVTGRQETIGIVAKGCDARNLAVHIVENKIRRDQLYIIGVPCMGMTDRHKLTAAVPGEIESVDEDESGKSVTVSGDGFSETFDRAEMLQENCMLCTHRNPVLFDEMIADAVPEQTDEDIDRYGAVRKVEEMNPEEKWVYFDDLLSDCIRCYACRNACPLCYCPTCFVDESKPQWVGKSIDPTDIRIFHFLRAYHCAGRCTDCGACVRSCPMGINVRALTKKLEKDCLEYFGWEAGLTTERRPPLDTYKPDDPEQFIK